MALSLRVLPEPLAVCRLDPGAALPQWVLGGALWSVTHTPDELSVVCEAQRVPPGVQMETGWRALQVAGPLDFSLTGILAGISGVLAEARISLFAVSTYDTDYVLVKEDHLPRAMEALSGAGYTIL
jgi:uncharacterized protein